MLNNPHRFTTVASSCSVGGPQGALLMHVQKYVKKGEKSNSRLQEELFANELLKSFYFFLYRLLVEVRIGMEDFDLDFSTDS